MKHICIVLSSAFFCSTTAAQLSGTKTIGGTTPDFATVTAAVGALMSQGASGNVTFNIRPGTYIGQYSLGAIPGTPGNIRFQSETDNADDVRLKFNAEPPAANYILEVDGTNNLSFHALTFIALNPDHARAVHLFNDANQLQLTNCKFIGSANPSTSNYFDRILVQCDQNVIDTPENPDDLVIDGCTFLNGNEAIDLDFEQTGGVRSEGLRITNNRFIDQVGTGVYINSAVGQFGDNFMSTTVGNGFTGLRTTYFDSGSQIRRNVLQLHATANGCTGMEIGNTQSTTGNLIHNNMITVGTDEGEPWGMAVYNLWGMAVAYNSVALLSGSAGKAFYHLSNFPDGQDVIIRNNIFANYAGGPAIETIVPENIATEDHNCLWSAGGVLVNSGGTEYLTQLDYQNATGDGIQDIVFDPDFPALPDLHVNSCVLGEHGEFFFVAGADIDGDARENPACDIGADEYTYSFDYTAPSILVFTADLPYTLSAPAGSGYTWNQGSTTPEIEVTTAGPYSCLFTDVNGCTYTIHWMVNVDFIMGVADEPTNTVSLYPVPASDGLFVQGLPPGVRYEVLDMRGRIALAGTTTTLLSMDVSGLGTGMHLLRWYAQDGAHSARFMRH